MKSCNKATMESTGGGVKPRVPHSQLPHPKNLISDIVGKYCDMELSAEQIDKLETVVSGLPFGEQNAIRYRYKYRFTLRQAGKKIGMSESRVSGYQKKSIAYLKKAGKSGFILSGRRKRTERFKDNWKYRTSTGCRIDRQTNPGMWAFG